MSDAAVLIPRLDSLPQAAGAPAPQAVDTAPAGGFAGVLSGRMQDAQAPDSPPVATSPAALPAEDSGDASPRMGKPLPLAVADSDNESDGDASFLSGLPSPFFSPLDVTEGGLPVSPSSAQTLAGSVLLPSVMPLDGAPLADTPQPHPDSALAITTTDAKPLPMAVVTPPSASLQSVVTTNTPAVNMPDDAVAINPASLQATQAANLESRPPDWLAIRMAKAGGFDSRSAMSQATSLNKPDGHASGYGGGQDFLQMLGLRPASSVAAGTVAGADGIRPMMTFLPERFPGEGLPATTAASPGNSDVSATGMFSMAAQAPAVTSPSMLPTLSVAAPVGQGTWSQDIGQRVTWLANQEIREAQIQLNPRHLGPVEVRIAYGQEQQLSVSFVAHHPQAREALDAMLPRLREMFDGQGLNLANVSVSQESFTERRRDFASNPNASRGYSRGGDVLDEMDAPPLQALATGLFDAYA